MLRSTERVVELGLMDAETIAIEQRNLTRDQIIASFELVQGRFTVMPGATPDAQTPTFDFGPGEIYVQGYRRYAPAQEMMAAYETLHDKYLMANDRLANYRPKLGLTGEDERLLRLLGEALTVEEAVERADLRPEAAARLLSALQALELVEEWSPGVEQFRSRIQAERQRHAEELAQLVTEWKKREERVIDTFERVVQKLGGAAFSTHLPDDVKRPGAATTLFSTPEKTQSEKPSPSAPTASPFATRTFGSSGREPNAKDNAAKDSAAKDSAAKDSAIKDAGVAKEAAPAVKEPPPKDTAVKELTRDVSVHSSPTSPAVGSQASGSTSGGTGSPKEAHSSPFAAAAAAVSTPPRGARENGAAQAGPMDFSPAELKYREGLEQASSNRLDEAEVTLREAVRIDATKPEYLTALARVLLANPRYERTGTLPVVRSLLDRAVQLAPDNADAQELHQQILKEMAG
jgi:hypothetical protein